MNNKWGNYWLLVICFGWVLAIGSSSAENLEQQRLIFVETDRLLDQQKYSAARAKMILLHDYALLPYLEYKLLKHNLNHDKEIKAFLSSNRDTRYSPILRYKWLVNLSQRQQWRSFIQQWRGSERTSLQCLYQLALYHTGKKQQALQAASKLWLVGHSQPDECDDLFQYLDAAGKISKTMVWKRFDLALQKGNVNLAKFIMGRLNQKEQETAKFWLKVHHQPDLIENNVWTRFYTHQGSIFSHGIRRMLRSDPQQAIMQWDLFKDLYDIDSTRQQEVENKLALQLIYNRETGAYQRLAMLGNDNEKVRLWRVRAALREQNWQHVNTALSHLTESEKQQPKWLYWQARAYAETGNLTQAQKFFAKAAKDRSFYGFMAAEANHLNYHFNDKPIVLKPGTLDQFLAQPDFAAANEFRILDRDIDARRQWWFAVAKLNKEEIKTAAKLAQLWHWNHIAVFTVAKAKYWDDLNLRFPVLYGNEVNLNARGYGVDSSLLYGLIRQESVFNRYARSPVGARGLMQIMPRTGRQIARELGEKWRSNNNLFNSDVNIKYGSYYYKKLLNQFNGHYALAAAAYNAGPHRVDRWLPEREMLPTDIWIETIPFNETRKYVAKVLAYALIYQNRTGKNTLSMNQFNKKIYPRLSIN